MLGSMMTKASRGVRTGLLFLWGFGACLASAFPAPVGSDSYFDHLQAQLAELGLEGGRFILGEGVDSVLSEMRRYGAQVDRMALRRIQAEPDETFAGEIDGREIEILRPTAHPWSAILGWPGAEPVEAGDHLLLSVWIRSLGSREANTVSLWVEVKSDRSNFAKVVGGRKLAPGPEWQQYFFPVRIQEAAGVGEWKIEFFVGGPTQALQFAGFAFVDFDDRVALADLPRTEIDLDYPGRAADAPWRVEAAERIELHRKGDLSINVSDGAGNPVSGAEVKVEMVEHAFLFGSVLETPFFDPNYDAHPEADRKRYFETFEANFNTATVGTYKWEPWRGKWGPHFRKEHTLAATQWASDNGYYVHGHTPIWHQFGVMPFAEGTTPVEAIRSGILGWLDEVLSIPTVRDHVDSWDGINHPFAFSKVWRDYGERSGLAEGGRELHLEELAKYREHVPEAKIFVNEGGVLTRGGSQLQQYREWVRWLLERDAHVHGVGFMCHFDTSTMTGMEDLKARLDAFAEIGDENGYPDLALRVTEFDVAANLEDEREVALQAAYTRDFYTLLFSHPSVDGIIAWGFWEGRMWKSDAAWYDRNWNLRANGRAYRDLVFGEWWTRERLRTDTEGRASLRGYQGTYRVEVTRDGERRSFTTEIGAGGARLEIVW